MPRRVPWLLALAVSAALGASAVEPPPVDRLELASVLMRDGLLERAEAVLAEVDPLTDELDLARYHALAGLVALQAQRSREAAEHLVRALQHGARDPMLHVFLAQALFGMGDHRGSLRSLEKAGATAVVLAGAWLLGAQAHWRLGERDQAWAKLASAARRFPEVDEIRRHKVLLLVDMGLFSQAAEEGAAWLGRAGARTDEHLALAEALRRGGQLERALRVLEEARLRHPGDTALALQLARTLLDSDRPLAAAQVLLEAAHREPRLRLEAAELFRRAGQLRRALWVNAGVSDQAAKTRQRLGLLTELGRFDSVLALAPRVERLGLAQDDALAYALAYACYRTGRLDEVERWLRPIRDPDAFRRANELRRALEICRLDRWSCE
jgi:tetratricopeptide (TPR) repeat protein